LYFFDFSSFDLFRAANIPLLPIQITAGTSSRIERGYGYVSKLELATLLQVMSSANRIHLPADSKFSNAIRDEARRFELKITDAGQLTFGAGCTSSPTTTSPSPLAQTTQTAQTNKTAQASGSSKDLMLTVAPLGEQTTIGISKAGTGNKFVLYNAVLKNIDVTNLSINPLWFDLRLSNGSSVGIDLFAWASVTEGRFPVTNGTAPGDTVNGTIVFEIPQTATPVAITYNDIFRNVTANL
jgi:hypothetical protein